MAEDKKVETRAAEETEEMKVSSMNRWRQVCVSWTHRLLPLIRALMVS